MKQNSEKILGYLKQALDQLQSYVQKPVEDDRDKAGIIQAFEFSFELTWKAAQKIAGERGVKVASPKSALGFVMQEGWILPEKELSWLKMLEDRNLTSHTYDQGLANEIYERISREHLSLLLALYGKLKAAA